MTTSKRKIKAKPFVRDLRNGMGDRELMEKYTLSESQLHKVLHKLVDAGAIDEMELFMRTSLSDGIMTKDLRGHSMRYGRNGLNRKKLHHSQTWRPPLTSQLRKR